MSIIPSAENLYQILLRQLKELRLNNANFYLAGLANGGALIAERLAKDLNLKTYGIINVSFHRDDYEEKGFKLISGAEDMTTKLPFDVDGAHVILVDDVLDTGRTVRAAMNELFDYGRPYKIDLAVLADRHRRQLPVDATFKAAMVRLADNQMLVLEQRPDGCFEFKVEVKE